MKKIWVLLIFLIAGISSYSEITLKIVEPIRFKHINTRTIGEDKIAGEGTIEIHAEEEDIGKKLTFKFPEFGLMTNMKRWIKIEKYIMEDKDKNFEIVKENDVIKFYAILNRRNLDKGELAEVIEGEYVSYVPIVVRQFGKVME